MNTKRMKKINHNYNRLFTSIIALVFAIIMMMSVGYAWFTTSQIGKINDFVVSVADIDVDYSLKSIVDGEITTDIIEASEFIKQESVPGDKNYFVLVIENIGNVDINLDIYFNGISSLIWDNENDNWVNVDPNDPKKIQYGFAYRVLYSDYIVDSNDSDLEQVFNGLDFISPSIVAFNQSDSLYSIDNEISLLTNTNTNNKYVIYFEIDYLNEPILPSGISDVVTSNDYIEQKFLISNIVIDCQ